jgi:hypothetical protein
LRGENNPNYGNFWSVEQKQIGSQISKTRFESEEMRYKAGSANRGKVFSEDLIFRMHGHRTSESYSRIVSEETKMIIGIKSKQKFTEEYNSKFRNIMEESGYWVPLKDIDPYSLYFKEAGWIGNMIKYFDEIELSNLKLFGIFSSKNPTGYVRDHIFPRRTGYEFNVPVQLLRHPANLKFISHQNNVSKGFIDRRMLIEEKSNSLVELYDRILRFDKEWFEHELCIKLINERRYSDV